MQLARTASQEAAGWSPDTLHVTSPRPGAHPGVVSMESHGSRRPSLFPRRFAPKGRKGRKGKVKKETRPELKTWEKRLEGAHSTEDLRSLLEEAWAWET